MPKEVQALAAQYDAAAASLDANTARIVFMQTQALQTVLGSFTGLRFVREVIDNATSITPAAAGALEIQGTIDAHAPCPGWSVDDTSQGFIDVAIGVDATSSAFRPKKSRSCPTLTSTYASEHLAPDLAGPPSRCHV